MINAEDVPEISDAPEVAVADATGRPIRAERRKRVRTTALDECEVVTAQLGTWAGAIGAAVHGDPSWPGRAPASSGDTDEPGGTR